MTEVGREGMRAAVFLVVLAIHVALLFVFAVRGTAPPHTDWRAPTLVFFLPAEPQNVAAETRATAPTTAATTGRAPRRPAPAAKKPEVAASPATQPQNNAITSPEQPDWRHELQIAANSQIESAERRRQRPSPLEPHDFSKVKPGSTDDSRREFGWDHAATHRVEVGGGAVVININDRCVIAWAIIPLAFCRIGRIPTRGDLFDHMKETPDALP